jgi:AcrR family transcriptional regulator
LKSSCRRSGRESISRILAAADKVFAEKGYIKTTIQEVAKKANISVGGVYIYFQNKDKLYIEVMRRYVEDFRRITETLRDKEPAEALHALFTIYSDASNRNAKMITMSIKEFDLQVQKHWRNTFYLSQKSLIADILKKGVNKGIFRKLDCEKTADIIISCLKGLMLAYLSGEIESFDAYKEILYRMILKDISTDSPDSSCAYG